MTGLGLVGIRDRGLKVNATDIVQLGGIYKEKEVNGKPWTWQLETPLGDTLLRGAASSLERGRGNVQKSLQSALTLCQASWAM